MSPKEALAGCFKGIFWGLKKNGDAELSTDLSTELGRVIYRLIYRFQ